MMSYRKVLDLRDLLTTALSLNDALHMAASDGRMTPTATNALQALSGEIDNKLRVIDDRLEELIDEVEFQQKALEAVKKVVDADALMASVRAELAKRRTTEAGA